MVQKLDGVFSLAVLRCHLFLPLGGQPLDLSRDSRVAKGLTQCGGVGVIIIIPVWLVSADECPLRRAELSPSAGENSELPGTASAAQTSSIFVSLTVTTDRSHALSLHPPSHLSHLSLSLPPSHSPQCSPPPADSSLSVSSLNQSRN